MLEFYYDFIDKYIERADFELLEMDTDSNYFAFSADNIDKIIKPHMRDEYEKDKYNFLPSESQELHPTFQVDETRFTYEAYEKRTPGLFKVEAKKHKMISLCSKMYCAADSVDIGKDKFSCKGVQKANNNISYDTFKSVLHGNQHTVINQGFRYVAGGMNTYEQSKKGLSSVYHKRQVQADGVTTIPLNI
jgi:hypothetical protein